MADMSDAMIESGCITGTCGTCTLCVEGKVIRARWEAYESLLCPGCKVVKSVSSRRYSHEDLYTAENTAYQKGMEQVEDAVQVFGRAFAEGWGAADSEGSLAIVALLDSLQNGDHHV